MFVVTEPVSEVVAGALRSQVESGENRVGGPAQCCRRGIVGAGPRIPSLGGGGTAGELRHDGEIDFRNPLFAPFADARFNDFTRLPLWRVPEDRPVGSVREWWRDSTGDLRSSRFPWARDGW